LRLPRGALSDRDGGARAAGVDAPPGPWSEGHGGGGAARGAPRRGVRATDRRSRAHDRLRRGLRDRDVRRADAADRTRAVPRAEQAGPPGRAGAAEDPPRPPAPAPPLYPPPPAKKKKNDQNHK